jgi:tagaturonate epimerase
MQLPKYSMGVGDRFARQGAAQLDAIISAARQNVVIAPVWNKSHREHQIVGSRPADVRMEADRAVQQRGWTAPYFVDADHVNLQSVDSFLESSDFFTLDVADKIGTVSEPDVIARLIAKHRRLVGHLDLPGIDGSLVITEAIWNATARKFLEAVREAGRIYRRIEAAKGAEAAVIEVSMDETDTPQTPAELLVILAAVADEGIPAQTIAPRFSGRFNKGVDYVGSPESFAGEFENDLSVLDFAVHEFGLPDNLKLSVHSGSDKFSLYPLMHEVLRKHNAGVHLKTAGTTWLEELIGLATAGGDGLELAKEVYVAAAGRIDALCAPYAAVIDIDRSRLPSLETARRWNETEFSGALRHDPTCKAFNPSLRQLLHVAYRVAAELGSRYLAALDDHAAVIAQGVTENLFRRHIGPLFLGVGQS